MDKTQLVASDIDGGRRFTEALLSKFPVRASMWFYDVHASEWRFLIAMPLVDTGGPRAAYAVIQKVLSGLDPPTDLLFRKFSAVSPEESLIKELRNAIRVSKVSGIRFTHNTVNNLFIEDAFIYLLD